MKRNYYPKPLIFSAQFRNTYKNNIYLTTYIIVNNK